MEEGYYISAYCDIDSLGNLLGTSLRHDHNIALWKIEKNKLTLLHHCELERVSGYKHHDISFYCEEDFFRLVDAMIAPYGITHDEILGYIGIPQIAGSLNVDLDNSIAYHSICHLYGGLGMNSKCFYEENILALALDGEPDNLVDHNIKNKFYFAGGYSKKGHVETFPISSPGPLWGEAVEELHMQEGTLMALATASRSKSYLDYKCPECIMNMKDSESAQVAVHDLCEAILAYSDEDAGKKFNFYDQRFGEYENKVSMIMKCIHEWSITIIDRVINQAIRQYGIEPDKTCISLSGGYALNCPTNTYVMNKYGFKKQLILPCVNDGGQAIGIGLHYFYHRMEQLDFCFEDAYLGNDSVNYDPAFNTYIESIHEGLDYFAEDIKKAPVAWFNGRAESGPRALGNRSLLADPRQMDSKTKLNQMKQREWWRPVAPVILEEETDQWFENSFDSKFMLNNFKIREEKKSSVPAIPHLDDTCRVQTVGAENPLLHKAVECFKQKSGVPILCNTSLNDKGEPIIDTIDQALNFVLRKHIDIAYINGKRFKLKKQLEYEIKEPFLRDNHFFSYSENKALCEKANPYLITAKEYDIYWKYGLSTKYDLKKRDDIPTIKNIVKKIRCIYSNRFQ